MVWTYRKLSEDSRLTAILTFIHSYRRVRKTMVS